MTDADPPAVSAAPVAPDGLDAEPAQPLAARPYAVPSIGAELVAPRRYRHGKHFAVAGIIGAIVGLLAVLFQIALEAGETSRNRLLAHLHATAPTWGWAVLPAIGMVVGCAVGLITRIAPEAGGSGIPHLKAVLLGVRPLRALRLMPVKFVGGVLGIGAGLSLGREGPTVQMGAAAAQLTSRVLGVPSSVVPQLLSAGAGAGLAAAFNAPLAGFIFVLEELHRELSKRTFIGALIAAVVATAVSEAFTGQVPSFQIKQYEMLPLKALPFAVVLGVVGGLVGVAFNAAIIGAQRVAVEQRRVPYWTLPGIVAAAVGLIAWWMPYAVGGGHGAAHELLSGHFDATIGLLTLWLVVKFATTIFSYASGAPGGIFAPMLLLGAILGAIVAGVTSHLPGVATYSQAFAVLGMAAVFVGSVRAPLTGIILISEMTENYQQLFALCVTCLSAHLVGEWMRAAPIYDELMEIDLHRRGIAPIGEEAKTIYLGVQRGAPIADKPIRDARLPAGALIVAIERSGRAIVPSGGAVLLPGDHLTVSIPGATPNAAVEVARRCLPEDD